MGRLASQPATSLRSHGPSFHLGYPPRPPPRIPEAPAAVPAPTLTCPLKREREIPGYKPNHCG